MVDTVLNNALHEGEGNDPGGLVRSRIANPQEWGPALTFLFGHLPPHERREQVKDLLKQVAEGELSLAGLVVAEAGGAAAGSYRGVMLTVLQKDGTAMIFPPVLAEITDRKTAEGLLHKTTEWFETSGGKLAQCLIEQNDHLFAEVLAGGGYPRLAELVFLKRELEDLPPLETGDLIPVNYSAETHDEFVATLGETYIDSQDCPALSSARSAEEALAGHREAGKFLPEQWTVYRKNGESIGLSILTEHTDAGLWELVYLGLRPAFRGQGFARKILIAGLHQARNAGMSAMTLAVDAANEPAIRLYAAAGFFEVLRKQAHLRVRN